MSGERQIDEPVVLDVSLSGKAGVAKTIVDADVIAPMYWGVEQHQLASLKAIYEAGL